MIWSIGWKNIWRNKTRSIVVIVSVMLGLFGGIMATGIMLGWIEQRIHDSIYNQTAHVQVHHPEFLYNEEMQYTIEDLTKVTGILDTISGVKGYSTRVKSFAMAKSTGSVSGFYLLGIDPDKERQVSELYSNLIEGEFFENDYRLPSIVIGSKAAENLQLLNYQVTQEKLSSIERDYFPDTIVTKLEQFGERRYRREKDFREDLKRILSKEEYVKYGTRLTDYFSFYRMGSGIELTIQDKTGELIFPVFRLRGVYKTDNSAFDAMNAFVDRHTLNGYMGFSDMQVHEIAILSTDNETGVLLAKKLKEIIPGHHIMSWREITPDVAMYTDFSNVMGLIYVGIILLALAFGIINTMLMSVMERTKELGMLMAIGMNKKRVFGMIMTESVLLTLTGAVIGIVFSGAVVQVLGKTGINFSMWSEGFEALGYASIVYPYVTLNNYLGILVLVVITGIVAAIWPARKALKLNPVEALRTE